MPESKRQLERIQMHHQEHFSEMGLATRAMPDGRSLLVSLTLSGQPFESIAGPIAIERVVFSTVGADCIKCLRPRPLFDLPLLDIRSCQNVVAIESEIRRAFRDRMQQLQDAKRWLTSVGIESAATAGGATLFFPLPGESPDTRIFMQDRHTAILPGVGPLKGLALASPAERCIKISDQINSSADLECLFGARIDDLVRRARKSQADHRARAVRAGPAGRRVASSETIASPGLGVQRKILLVGPNLIMNADLRSQLGQRRFRVATARSEPEAIQRLASMTPDLVLSEYALGRSDGATLVQATHALAGIETIPVVLIDTSSHERRRAAARAVGAAGYVVDPPDIERFVARLSKLLDERKGRRFTRYSGRFQTRLEGLATPCLATELGRGGVFIATNADVAIHSAMSCEMLLPELGRDLHFAGEVLYRAENQGALPGLGLRFQDISSTDEALLIEYLEWLERR